MHARMRDAREIIREEMFMRDMIVSALKEGPKTVPEVADKINHPVDEVMFWVMGARKYGYIEELPEATDEGYFQYKLAEQDENEKER
jgi:predicted Rossmann fold nucleotide-binding protein DprA/Smf involved in DNA uptake